MNLKFNKLKQELLIAGGCIFLALVLIGMTSSYFNAFIVFMMICVSLFLFSFTTRSSKQKSMLLLACLIMLIVTFFEVIALFYYRVNVLNAPDIPKYTFGRTQYWIEDKELGYKPRPARSIQAKKSINGNLIYDTEYSFTSNSLRTTKSNLKSQCTFLFFGGSRMFGEGLPDLQTLPYQFSRKLNYNYSVFNYAFHGYGPHHMLRILEKNDLIMAKGKIGVIFYLLAPDDLEKISGNLERFQRGPKYVLDDGSLKYVGDLTGIGGMFNSYYDFKQSIGSLLKHSQLINYLFKFSKNSRNPDNRYELLLAIIKKADMLAREKYNSKFGIILINGENTGNNMLLKLADNNINYIKISEFLSRDWGEYYLLQDKINFNEKLNNELAIGLANRFGSCN